MSKRVLWKIVLPLVGMLITGLVVAAGVSAHEAWPIVKPQITAAVNGDLITYTVWLKNQTDDEVDFIDLKVKVPSSTTFVTSYAGGPWANQGTFDGASVGWYIDSIDGGMSRGPFVVIVKAKPWVPAKSEGTFSGWAWVRWQSTGEMVGGEATSNVVATANPLDPANTPMVVKAGQEMTAAPNPFTTKMEMESAPASAVAALPPELVAKGKDLFAAKGCAGCHGATGEGGVGPTLRHWHDSDEITSVVRNGEKMMPAYGVGQIAEDELNALVAFVQSLAGIR